MWGRRPRAALIAALLAGTVTLIGTGAPLAAQGAGPVGPEGAGTPPAEPGDTTSTTGGGSASSSTTSPPTTAASTTTSTLPSPDAPPGPAGDPLAELFASPADRDAFEALDGAGDARSGYYEDQPGFDPARYNAVLDSEVARARAEVGGARRVLGEATAARQAADDELDAAESRLERLGGERRAAATWAAEAQRRFEDRAVAAYIRGGDEGATALMGSTDAGDWLARSGLVSAVLDRDEASAHDLRSARAELDAEAEATAAEAAVTRRRAAAARQDEALAALVLAAAEADLAVWEAGSHVAVRGFVFPVAGEVQFIDSFGAPRNVGTSYAHWHEGTDVMAARGTPVVAVEAGVIERAASNRLGGNALRLRGESGHGYYYAHLDGYAEGVVTGLPVAPGQVLGWVGDTGDARGGAPHLHFEIRRPPDDGPVNPYPILLLAWQAREDVVGLHGPRRPSPHQAPPGSAFGVVPPPGEPIVAGLSGGTPPATVPELLRRPQG